MFNHKYCCLIVAFKSVGLCTVTDSFIVQWLEIHCCFELDNCPYHMHLRTYLIRDANTSESHMLVVNPVYIKRQIH